MFVVGSRRSARKRRDAAVRAAGNGRGDQTGFRGSFTRVNDVRNKRGYSYSNNVSGEITFILDRSMKAIQQRVRRVQCKYYILYTAVVCKNTYVT